MTGLLNTLVRVTGQLLVLSMQLVAALLTAAVNLVTILVNTMNAKRNPPPRRGRTLHEMYGRKKWRK